MNIAEILQRQAQQLGDHTALIEKGRRLTFVEFEDHVARATTLLVKNGLAAGDAVLVFQPMSIELYVVLLAAFRAGLVVVFADPQSGRGHLESCCQRYPPQALIATTKAHLLRLVSPGLRAIQHKFVIGFPLPGVVRWNNYLRYEPHSDVHPSAPEDPALVTFTSGSTGLPKAAVRTHAFLLAQHEALAHSLCLRAGQVDLATLPIFVLANLASGVTSLIPDADLRRPGAIDPRPVMEQIRQFRADRCAASPAFFERLTDYCEHHGQKLDSFQQIYTGGAPVFPRLLDRLALLSPTAEVIAVYGSTEAEPIAHLSRREMSADDFTAMNNGKGLLAGPPVAEIALRIAPDQWGNPLGPFSRQQFDSLCLKPGEIGEIVVNGHHVLPGYLEGHGDEENKFEVGGERWHRTGDAGYLDQKGRLWLMGRCAARVVDAQGTIYSFAVDVAANQYDFVRRAAFLSHASQRLLVIEPRKGQKIDIHQVRKKLAWASLNEVKTLDNIPVDKRHNAKIDYPALLKKLDNR
ncbi:MAG: AMP-binding protein [Gammaproteobacteria bacterium]|nr:AMP-binding protein [Gammaproteobacteria bacterium]